LSRNKTTSETKNIWIFSGFDCWNQIITYIDRLSKIVLTGGDSSRRHLVEGLSLRLNWFFFLFELVNIQIYDLIDNIVFDLDDKLPKYLIAPCKNLTTSKHETSQEDTNMIKKSK
jgi:hypothetical protein